jgi:cardiolipin synthase
LGIGIQITLMIVGLFVARAAITTARTPQGAAAWVVFLVSFPLVALPAFAIFGSVSRLSSRPKKDRFCRKFCWSLRAAVL